jgi:hypothetical protein
MRARTFLGVAAAASLGIGVARAATLQTLFSFYPTAGWPPVGDLRQVTIGTPYPSGSLFGATSGGGSTNRGVLFILVPPTSGTNWTYYLINDFAGKFGGAAPLGSPLVFRNGAIEAATTGGGPWWSGGSHVLVPKKQKGGQLGPPRNLIAIPPFWDEYADCLEDYDDYSEASPEEFPPDEGEDYCDDELGVLPHVTLPPSSISVDVGDPAGTPLFDNAGGLYVSQVESVPQGGAVVHLTPPATKKTAWPQTVIYQFGQTTGDLILPDGPVYRGAKGVLYGAAELGGAHDAGGIYALTPPAEGQTAWTETILWSFGASGDGAEPVGNLLVLRDGTMFGTTRLGGVNSAGTVFKLSPPAGGQSAWTETVLHGFSYTKDVQSPVGTLYRDASGNLYGAATQGGTNFNGAIYELAKPAAGSTTWTESIVWSFTGGVDGAAPLGGLIGDANGNIYGTTSKGGTAGSVGRYPEGYGTIFMLTP